MKAWVALVLSLSIPFRILSITLGDLGLEREAQTRRDLNEDESAEELPHPYSDRKATAHSTPINYQDCPANYPDYGRQGDLLRAWSPNEPHAPEGLRESLKVRAVPQSLSLRINTKIGGKSRVYITPDSAYLLQRDHRLNHFSSSIHLIAWCNGSTAASRAILVI